MIAERLNILAPAPLRAGLNPLDKWQAARSYFASAGEAATGILILLAVLTLVSLAILGVAVHSHLRQRRRHRQFQARAAKSGLSDQERKLLRALAKESGLKQEDSVFVMPDAFEHGASRLLHSDAVGKMAPDRRQDVTDMLTRVRQKLGFDSSPGQGRPREILLGSLPRGATLQVYRPGPGDGFDATVTVAGAGGREITVLPASTVPCRPGEPWEIRFSEEGLLWEAGATVVRPRGEEEVVVRMEETARCINRRRFPRVGTNRPAYVAPFPFQHEALDADPPAWYPAVVVEIAGPGVRLTTPLAVQAGEKLLLGMLFADRRVLQAQVSVHRAHAAADGMTTLAGEMIALTTSEVAELTRRTTLAIQAGRARELSDEPEPAGVAEEP